MRGLRVPAPGDYGKQIMTTLAIDIRRADGRDAEAIADVHLQAWLGAYAGIIPHNALTRMVGRRGIQWWKGAIQRAANVLVVEIGGDVADLPNAVITEQVSNGVAVRMAVLFMLLGSGRHLNSQAEVQADDQSDDQAEANIQEQAQEQEEPGEELS